MCTVYSFSEAMRLKLSTELHTARESRDDLRKLHEECLAQGDHPKWLKPLEEMVSLYTEDVQRLRIEIERIYFSEVQIAN